MVAVVTLAVGAEVSVVELSVVVLSVVVVVVSEVLELLECSSFSPQEMMVRLKHEIRRMYINFFIFGPRKNYYIFTNKDEVIVPNLLAMSRSYFTDRDLNVQN